MYEQTVEQESIIDRRSFLRSALGVGIGAVAGQILLPPIASAADQVAEDVTNHPVGNAGMRDRVESDCASSPDPTRCANEWKPDNDLKREITITAPIMEEVAFRGLPSKILDDIMGDEYNEPYAVLAGGTEDYPAKRAEFIVGIASSLIFGAAHNYTKSGFDTKTIPASQTVGGFKLWKLLRRYGIGASIAAHMSYNAAALRQK